MHFAYYSVTIYNNIKTIIDTKAGIYTVCIISSKFIKEQR
jgi:eukaryotic translation initiation factor 2C